MNKSVFIFDTLDLQTLNYARELSLDSVFYSYKNVTSENVSLIKKELGKKIDQYIVIPFFTGKELLEKFPDAKPVEAEGKTSEQSLFYGVCPTHPAVKTFRLENVKETLKHNIDGIWMDFIRYPTKWEEPVPVVIDTCYCDRCLTMFEDYIGENVHKPTTEETVLFIDGSYYYEWIEFKTQQILSMVREVRELIDKHNKNNNYVKLGIFVVPWREDEHSAGIKRILGQDVVKMANYADVISPMLYHKMVNRSVEWINQMVNYYWELEKPILPLIQTEPKIHEITDSEFAEALKTASRDPSDGVCIFFLKDLVKQKEKFKFAKEFFSKN